MIRAEGVAKRLGTVLAVDSISLRVAPGEIVGLLGPNGAGKSTLLRMLATYFVPDQGTIEIHGHDAVREPLAVRRAIGYLPEHNALFESMRARELLDFVGRVRGLAGEGLKAARARVIDRCGLEDVARKRVRECSKGYRQRLGLAAALIHDPPVLLLDEPTHGLDPLQVAAFRDLVLESRAGRAIVFSSHVLAEVAAVSTRIVAMHGGRIVLDEDARKLSEAARARGATLEDLVLGAVRGDAP
ncbi:MAG: ABC transporter ATP-binding protein [Planctomycetota bacterium]